MKNNRFLAALLVAAAGAFTSIVGAQPLNDPAIHGMRNLPMIDGCNAPGGLTPITSSDSPESAMFWCGVAPYCLTMPIGNSERCHIVPGSRNGGTTGVRNPQDLVCDTTSLQPTGPSHATPGRCPIAPTLQVTVNNAATTSVTRGGGVTLRVNTANATPLSAPDSLTMACSGANAGLYPFNQTDLNSYAGQDRNFGATSVTTDGVTNCTVNATNPAGTTTASVSFTVTAPIPAPTVSASFSPTTPTAGGSVRLTTSTANATSLRWSCSGRWTNSNTNRSTGNNIRTDHTVPSSAGTANCTFTATGPSGSTSTTASWTSAAASGGGSGGGGSIPVIQNCAATTISATAKTYECYTGRNYCSYNVPALSNGATRFVYGSAADYCGGGAGADATVQCNNGTLQIKSYTCWMSDGGG